MVVDLTAPYTALFSPAEGAVLAVLAGTTKPLSGREVARLSGTSPNGSWRVLQRLAQHGVASTQRAGGKTILYVLNREHVASGAIVQLMRLRSELTDRIRDQVTAWETAPMHVSLFGSAARGDGDTASDVDVLVIRPRAVGEDDARWRRQIDDLAEAIHRWTGNHAGVAEVAQVDLPQLGSDRPAIVERVERESILLFGEPASRLLRKRRR